MDKMDHICYKRESKPGNVGKGKKKIDCDGKAKLEHTGTLVDSERKAVLKPTDTLVDSDGIAVIEPKGTLVNSDGEAVIQSTDTLVDSDAKALLEPTDTFTDSDGKSALESMNNLVYSAEKPALEPTDNFVVSNGKAVHESTDTLADSDRKAEPEPAAILVSNDGKSGLQPTDTLSHSDEKAVLKPTDTLVANDERAKVECMQTMDKSLLKKELDNTPIVENGKTFFRCTGCKFTCTSETKLQDHMMSHENFLCHHCGRKFKTYYSLRIHMKAHMFDGHKNLTKCDICGEVFPGSVSLSQHKRAHQTLSSLRCKECGKTFSKKSNLEGHKLIHQAMQPFTCDTCGEEFAFKSLLKIHIRGHIGELFECNICGKGMKRKESLQAHMLIHCDEPQFKCMFCTMTFKTKNGCNRHQKIHTNTNHFTCKFCNASYLSRKTLREHMARHTDSFLYKCKFCDHKFNRKGEFVLHSKYHIAENMWKCLRCEKVFSNKNLLTWHKLKFHGKRYSFKCEFCGEGFTVSNALQEHKKVHIAENSWKCLACFELFSDMMSLEIHREKCSYYKRKAFKCQFRLSTFKRARKLTCHNRVHIAENIWKCILCDNVFGDENAFKIHKKECQNPKSIYNRDDVQQDTVKESDIEHLGSLYKVAKIEKKTHQIRGSLRIKNKIQYCKTCGFKIAKGYHKISHFLLHGAKGIYEYICIPCGKRFSTAKGLKLHSKEYKCEKACSQKCDICDMVFENRFALLRHKETHKSGVSYQCNKCNRVFKKKFLFYSHVLGHKGTLIYKCKKCFSPFNCKTYFSYHNRIHNNIYRCERCSAKFDSKQLLLSHRKCHKSITWFKKCLFCLKYFHDNCFTIHMESHKNIRKKHVCKFCNTRYEKRSDMIRHRAKNFFKCHLCKETFHTKQNLNAHKIVHVAKSDWKCKRCRKVFPDFRKLVIHYNCNHGIWGNQRRVNKKKCSHCSEELEKSSAKDVKISSKDVKSSTKHAKSSAKLGKSSAKQMESSGNCVKISAKHMKNSEKYMKNSAKEVKGSSIEDQDTNATVVKDTKYQKARVVKVTKYTKVRVVKDTKNTKPRVVKETKYTKPNGNICNCCHCRSKSILTGQPKLNIDVKQEIYNPHFCVACGFEFSFFISLQEHDRRWHLGYSCYHCKLEFTNNKEYNQHMETHEYTCCICQIKFKRYLCLIKHLKMHEIGYKCNLCGEKFDEIPEHKQHVMNCMMLEKELDEKDYNHSLDLSNVNNKPVCQYCMEKFDSKVEIDKHMKVSHAKIYNAQNSYYCVHCGLSFDKLSQMKIHTDIHKNKCVHFKTEFSSLEEWKDSKLLYSNGYSRIIRCDKCAEIISLNSAPDYSYLVRNTLGVQSCIICQKYFLQEKRLAEHYAEHNSKQDNAKSSHTETTDRDKNSQKASMYQKQSISTYSQYKTYPLIGTSKYQFNGIDFKKQGEIHVLHSNNKIMENTSSPIAKEMSKNMPRLTVNIQNKLKEWLHTQNNQNNRNISSSVNPSSGQRETQNIVVGLPVESETSDKVPVSNCSNQSENLLNMIPSVNWKIGPNHVKPIDVPEGNGSCTGLQEGPFHSVNIEVDDIIKHEMINDTTQSHFSINENSVGIIPYPITGDILSDIDQEVKCDVDRIRKGLINDHTYDGPVTQLVEPVDILIKTEEETTDECIEITHTATFAGGSEKSSCFKSRLAHNYDQAYDIEDDKSNVFNITSVIT